MLPFPKRVAVGSLLRRLQGLRPERMRIAPLLLGEGRGVLAHPMSQTLAGATRFQRVGMKALGDDVLIEYVR